VGVQQEVQMTPYIFVFCSPFPKSNDPFYFRLNFLFIFRIVLMATENVDDIIKDLKKVNGFAAYAILNNDGRKTCKYYLKT
jgi:hypothetical protein